MLCDGPFRRGLGHNAGRAGGPYKTSESVITQRVEACALKILAACAALSALLALSQSGAQLASPLAQEEAGTAPDEVLCNEGLVLVMRASGAACLRPATADRLGLETVARPERHADAPAVSDGALADLAGQPENNSAQVRAHALVPAPDFKPAIQHPETGERLECVWEQCYAVSPSSETYAGLHGAQCSKHGKCFVVSDVPPPKEREPLVFFSSFRGEPIRTTIMVDPDRTGYWSTATKAELDELLPRLAGSLYQSLIAHTIADLEPAVRAPDGTRIWAAIGAGFENARWQDQWQTVAGDDFDFTSERYDYLWSSNKGWFTAHNGLDGGKIEHQSYTPVPGSPTGKEFAAEFMDTMGFDGWSIYVGKVWSSGLIHGTVLDQTTDLLELYKTTGPTVQQVSSFIQDARGDPELDPEKMTNSVWHIRNNYGTYRDAIFDRFEPDHIPLTAYNEGAGWISVGPVPDGMAGTFEGWSDYPIPKPAVSRTEAIERALEFAADDPVLSGPECGLSVQDRSVEDRPRYVYLDQVAGAPFWVVDMGACEVLRDLCHDDIVFSQDLLSMEEENAVIEEAKARGQWNLNLVYDPERWNTWGADSDQCRIILEKVTGLKINAFGRINSSAMDKAPYMPYHQHVFNRVHEINVDVFVDALDGQTAWFRENEEWDSDIRWRNSFFEDENVWFLEDGKVTFASEWPKGYIYETVWLTDEMMR